MVKIKIFWLKYGSLVYTEIVLCIQLLADLFVFAIAVYQWLGLHIWCICWLLHGQLAVGTEGKSHVLVI